MIPRVAVKVRCDRLRVSTQATDPVVQVIDGNEQDVVTLDVGLLGSHGARMQSHEPSNDQQKAGAVVVSHTFLSFLLELENTFLISIMSHTYRQPLPLWLAHKLSLYSQVVAGRTISLAGGYVFRLAIFSTSRLATTFCARLRDSPLYERAGN